MKTTKIFSALSLALFVIASTAAFSGKPDKSITSGSSVPLVRYQVTVTFPNENTLCNLYEIQMLDEHGRMVAPSQIFKPGVSVYNFYEAGPAVGARIARLMMVTRVDHFVCPNELYSKPDVKIGTFENGRSYPFSLYATTQPPKN